MRHIAIAAAAAQPRGRFLRIADVVADIGLSQATINRLHRSGDFPPKVQISPGATGWWESDVAAWKASRSAVSRRS